MQQEPTPAAVVPAEPQPSTLLNIDKDNLYDMFFSVEAFLNMKSNEVGDEIRESLDKPSWYIFFLSLSAESARELYLTYYYYRFIYLPNALSVRERLERDFETSNFRKKLAEIKIELPLPSSLDRVVDELIYAGYIAINHKLEDILRYIQSHSSGKPYGQIEAPFETLYDYVSLLDTEFDFKLHKFFTEYIPRLQLIRNFANNIKHTNGYPKDSASDRHLLQLIGRNENDRARIIRTSDEFLDDSLYAGVAVNFFFKFIKGVHKVFLLMIEPTKNSPEFEQEKQAEVDNLRAMCHLIKNAADNEASLNLVIGFTTRSPAAGEAE